MRYLNLKRQKLKVSDRLETRRVSQPQELLFLMVVKNCKYLNGAVLSGILDS